MRRKTQKQETETVEIAEPETENLVSGGSLPLDVKSRLIVGLIFQGWIGIAFWMSFGLLNEGLIGFRIPAYIADDVRRELFRLAHAHGTLLSLMLLVAAFSINRLTLDWPALGIWALRIGVVMLPLGFLLGGIWHFKGDPGLGVWLVPPAALLVIFGAITMALAFLQQGRVTSDK